MKRKAAHARPPGTPGSIRLCPWLCPWLWAFFAASAASAQPILHEPLAVPELRCQGGACVREGASPSSLPDAVLGSDGLVAAPSQSRTPAAHEQVYSSHQPTALPFQRGAPGSDPPPMRRGRVAMDAETGPEPPGERVYHEVFNPAVFPYKRMTSLDAVAPDGTLMTADNRRTQIFPEGPRLRAGRDPFYGSIVVDFAANQEVALPTPAAGLRLLSYQATPAAGIRFFLDGAENLYARADRAGSHRLVYLADAEQRYFAGPLWPNQAARRARLFGMPAELLHALPRRVEHEAARVLRHIGVRPSPDADFVEVLNKLVGYFRAFKLGELDVQSDPGESMYLKLAMQQRGACRHRAYAFVITALAAGIPARYVENELHVFVEVYVPVPGERGYWRRINLGGAPLQQRVEGGDTKVAYQEKGGDPFERPASFSSGAAPSVSGHLPRRSPSGGGSGGKRRDGPGEGDGASLPKLDGPEDRAKRGEGSPGQAKDGTGKPGDKGSGDGTPGKGGPGDPQKGPGGVTNLDLTKPDGAGQDGPGAPGGPEGEEAPPSAPPVDDVQRPDDTRPESAGTGDGLVSTRVSVSVGASRRVYRGMAIPVRGQVTASRGPTAGPEVLLMLAVPGAPVMLGRAFTDASGSFQSEVEIPADTKLGKFPLVARVRGDETRRGSSSYRYDVVTTNE